ncbi:MAG: hypothetical protein JST84_22525 [Acidobacteria bacterium]|nr:hypothetical protein [Acidobacteriota bacterium]
MLYQAFGNGSIDDFLNVLTDDVVLEMPRLPDVDRDKGKKGVLQILKDREPAIRYDKFLPQEFIAQGDIVVVLGRNQRQGPNHRQTVSSSMGTGLSLS